MIQYDLFIDRSEYRDQVISEDPYVKVLGNIGWSPIHHQYAALAQVDSALCVVGLRLTMNGKPLYISAADENIHDTAARYKQ